MSVSRLNSAFIVTTSLALLAGCASTPAPKQAGMRGHMPAPGTHQARHPVIDPHLPALPPANSGRGGYYKDDGPGDAPPPGLHDVPDAVVRAEPYSRFANRPYVVFGRSYTPILGEQPFVQRGVSSWYGKKFHGQRTSSGELYDMYKMTAAHPTLPIPSYARITNIASGKSVVVRVNDRGPFHASRIVDVSYTAALKLGLLQKGSHEVEVERLLPNETTMLARLSRLAKLATGRRSVEEPPAPRQETLQAVDQVDALIVTNRAEVKAIKAHPETLAVPTGADPIGSGTPAAIATPSAPPLLATGEEFYLQMGAFSRAEKAAEVKDRITARGWVSAAFNVVRAGSLHRLLSGPFASRDAALEAARSLPAALGLKPIVIKR